jgi:hypothetical protein
VWNKAKGLDMPLKVHDVDDWLHPSAFYKLAKQLDKVGYAFDFASDRLLQQTTVENKTLITSAKAAPYQTLVIPKCELMEPQTLNKVINMAAEGANVIFQALPKDVPGMSNLPLRREKLKAALSKLNFSPAVEGVSQFKIGKGQIFLSAEVQKALTLNGLKREELTDVGLQLIRRNTEKGKYYYLVNHTSKAIDAYIPINEKGTIEILNPQDGSTGMAHVKDHKVRVQLKSGESLFLWVNRTSAPATRNWTYLDKPGKEIPLTNPWNLHFTAGGPELPADQKLNKLVSWTTLSDPKLQAFSGTGVYTSNFNLANKMAKEYLLQLNQVDESARVWVNGQEVGILWSIPFEARIGKFLKTGNNTIKIEVVNLMANRIRDLDVKKVQWRKYHEINFVNINYKEFDASNWSVMPSGLIGPVVIKPYF